MYKDVLVAILTRLKADTAIAAKVGTRIYTIPPLTGIVYPLIVLIEVSTKDNVVTDTSTSGKYQFQATTISKPSSPSRIEVSEIDDLIANSLSSTRESGITNQWLPVSSGRASVYVQDVEDWGSTPDNSDAASLGVFRANRSFVVNYKVE